MGILNLFDKYDDRSIKYLCDNRESYFRQSELTKDNQRADYQHITSSGALFDGSSGSELDLLAVVE